MNASPRQRTVLVVGGAGYIGSHTVSALLKAGYKVLILDDLSTGHIGALHALQKLDQNQSLTEVYIGSCRDEILLDRIFRAHAVTSVMHFGARALVGESVKDPLLYFDMNVSCTTSLLKQCVKHHIRSFVFSSTCATFGLPSRLPMDETLPQKPINPYGLSKLMVEQVLQETCRAYGLRSAVLRYFNAAGCSPEESLGEDHNPETHLIPNVFRATKTQPLQIHGTDYPTEDGTCVRDYVHVLDLAGAHIAAMEYLDHHEGYHDFNLGSTTGYSVKEVLAAVGRPVPFVEGPRRQGDPPRLVADSKKANEALNWRPTRTLHDIIDSVSKWQAAFPRGFENRKVLFLDRDGTLNADLGGNDKYVKELEDFIIIPGVLKAVIEAKKRGFLISLITNQAGIGKGLMDVNDLQRVHKALEAKLSEESGEIFHFDDIQFCPHLPTDHCYCRKPLPGMLVKSAIKLKANLKESIFVGDHLRDMECAKALGIREERVDTVRREDIENRVDLKKFRTLSAVNF